ncbi:MAG: hypothetical protein K6C36_08355 [Clostridia bacterium]|nr:hypothetical protein [Clostridia bacterium]
MPEFLKRMDVVMCCLWIVTELLCLIGIKKYRKPVLPPMSQLVIAPFEFAVVIYFIITHAVANYAFFSYIAWAAIEIVIVKYYYRYRLIPQKMKSWYIVLLAAQTAVLLVFILKVEGSFPFFGVFNTLAAIMIWFVYLFKPNYPMNHYTLCVFILKLCADLAGTVVYFPGSSAVIRGILVSMVLVDVGFFPAWAVLRRSPQKQKLGVKNKPKK